MVGVGGGGGADRSRHHHHFLVDKRTAIGFIAGIRLLLVDLVDVVSHHDVVCIDGLIVRVLVQLMTMLDELVCVGALHAQDGRRALLGRLANASGDHLSLVRVPQQFPTRRL